MADSNRDRSASHRQLNIRIEEELIEWFEEFYPQYGAKTWFFNEVLRQFKKMHDVSSKDMVKKSLRELLD